MNKKLMISIITPVCNAEKYFDQNIRNENCIARTPIFSKVNCGGLAQIDKVVYNYNRCDMENYASYLDYYIVFNKPYNQPPSYQALSWVEGFLKESKFAYDKFVWVTFNYIVVTQNIIPYFKYRKIVTKSKAEILYRKYYTNCNKKIFPVPTKS